MDASRFEGKIIVENGVVHIDTKIWKRPSAACDILEERGANVSRQMMSYWIDNDHVDSKFIDQMNQRMVDIRTVPEEMRQLRKLDKDE